MPVFIPIAIGLGLGLLASGCQRDLPYLQPVPTPTPDEPDDGDAFPDVDVDPEDCIQLDKLDESVTANGISIELCDDDDWQCNNALGQDILDEYAANYNNGEPVYLPLCGGEHALVNTRWTHSVPIVFYSAESQRATIRLENSGDEELDSKTGPFLTRKNGADLAFVEVDIDDARDWHPPEGGVFLSKEGGQLALIDVRAEGGAAQRGGFFYEENGDVLIAGGEYTGMLANCHVTDQDMGGAVGYMVNGNLTLADRLEWAGETYETSSPVFLANTAILPSSIGSYRGGMTGALTAISSDVSIAAAVFDENIGLDDFFGNSSFYCLDANTWLEGGALSIVRDPAISDRGSLSIDASLFSRNNACRGAAVYVYDRSPQGAEALPVSIRNSTFEENEGSSGIAFWLGGTSAASQIEGNYFVNSDLHSIVGSIEPTTPYLTDTWSVATQSSGTAEWRDNFYDEGSFLWATTQNIQPGVSAYLVNIGTDNAEGPSTRFSEIGSTFGRTDGSYYLSEENSTVYRGTYSFSQSDAVLWNIRVSADSIGAGLRSRESDITLYHPSLEIGPWAPFLREEGEGKVTLYNGLLNYFDDYSPSIESTSEAWYLDGAALYCSIVTQYWGPIAGAPEESGGNSSVTTLYYENFEPVSDAPTIDAGCVPPGFDPATYQDPDGSAPDIGAFGGPYAVSE